MSRSLNVACSKFSEAVVALPRRIKLLIVVTVDSVSCYLSTLIAFYLALGNSFEVGMMPMVPTIVSISLAIPVFYLCDLYKMIVRFPGSFGLVSVGKSVIAYGIVYGAVLGFVELEGTPWTIGIIQPMVLFFLLNLARLGAMLVFASSVSRPKSPHSISKVLIYGAGVAGRELAISIGGLYRIQVIAFLDDDLRLQGKIQLGIPIHAPADISRLVETHIISEIYLAMPSVSGKRHLEIMSSMRHTRLPLKILPPLSKILAGKVNAEDMMPPDLEELLGRDSVPPNRLLLSMRIVDQTILVTGAGGSIGGEICRAVLGLKPRKLLLFEISEYALYSIVTELHNQLLKVDYGVEVVPLLGSVQDVSRLAEVINTWRPDTIFHAAAYKHVPLIEQNWFDGIANNVFGSLNVAELACQLGVPNCVLISSDKAVRPTNVMGATKRVAELIFQMCHAKKGPMTCFSIVRFGNVLGSSGSVIPKFEAQIKQGGPVTITHTEATRFFMTIPEAAQLVIQANALAQGGEVFILDMGEPVRIIELARQLISMAGLREKTIDDAEGDIEIVDIGLRSGEKLYEELFYEGITELTSHPQIIKAAEPTPDGNHVSRHLDMLKMALDHRDHTAALAILQALVNDFVPAEKSDLVLSERISQSIS